MKIWINEPTLGLPVPDLTQFGKQMPLKKTNALHFSPLENPVEENIQGVENGQMSFSDMVLRGLEEVNHTQQDASFLTNQYAADPGSVEVNDLAMTLGKAHMELSIAKAIIDRTITSFKEILNQR